MQKRRHVREWCVEGPAARRGDLYEASRVPLNSGPHPVGSGPVGIAVRSASAGIISEGTTQPGVRRKRRDLNAQQ